MTMSDAQNQTQNQNETPEQSLNRALNAAKLRRVNEALGICQDVLKINPEHPGALGLMGGIFGQEGRAAESIDYLERALAKQPNVANWRLNLAALYRGRGDLDMALQQNLETVRLAPDPAMNHLELALTYLTRGEHDNCAKSFRAAMAREPENAAPHMGLGELLLAQGEYTPGWVEYEWRNKLDQAKGTLPKMVAAPWNGQKLPDGTLLLIADQGFGDMIQFARYIPMLKDRVGKMILGWGPEVTALLGDHPDIDICFPNWGEVPPHDAYVLLSSLPFIFGTTADTIPMPIPYIHMKQDRVEHWRNRLAELLPERRLRVGLAWAGRPTHPNNMRRSVRLSAFAPVMAVPNVDFVTIQKPVPDEDRPFMESIKNLHDISGELASFSETGALIKNLDLVIAVDTAVVHLAGAMGSEAWVLIANPSDWRWGLNREDTVWYNSIRLFRQTKPLDWSNVFPAVAAALQARAVA
jgi:Tfp pilus assembly protein PilF